MLQADDITYQMLGVIIYDANDDVCCRANLYAAPISEDEMIVKFETDLGNKGIRTVKGKTTFEELLLCNNFPIFLVLSNN